MFFHRSTIPFLSDEEFQTTEKLCTEFSAEGGVGEKLQKYLEERAEKTDNWVLIKFLFLFIHNLSKLKTIFPIFFLNICWMLQLSEWWARVVYLANRSPLPLNQSVGSLHPLRDPKDDQVAYGAGMLAGFLFNFNKLLTSVIFLFSQINECIFSYLLFVNFIAGINTNYR